MQLVRVMLNHVNKHYCSIVICTLLTAPEDFQLSNDMLTFVDGTSELQQCIDLIIVADNILEQLEFFTLVATPSSGSAANQLFLITNNDSEYILNRLKFTELILLIII